MKIYTRKGDDGTTGLFYGGRVRKDSPLPTAYGEVDEAQAAIGLTRSLIEPESEIDFLVIQILRDLWVLMAELATLPENRVKLKEGISLVTADMVKNLEDSIDKFSNEFSVPEEFVVPGQNHISATFDLARTVVRRAERAVLKVESEGSLVLPYLNRLSDLMWILARLHEEDILTAKITKKE
ncbi:MAG: cob(I)yrinic acid a,c-diamide adenosyltransferase [Acidimicrobiales bacterium]|jgi:cob(I)alamin adenosyltransferase|nr:cob(I)yrinic acid a,c-diamide adenosyltransferase [Acidimicrobiales bacterium]MDP6299199.1 cob(I)yrinic acid a,c-diamide adenosyltransferase [Acidimicrobiales bacterium]HJM27976.1 cob(I)yrinic acid a,c-diamide adenosyltransferase [Acidimicrobiales bacterium]HJM97919.1 cob(I)yrinic acid a,c-diamide adenosyltransferase [Acidimicrobiales bacterium]